jgi:hypothetical protein
MALRVAAIAALESNPQNQIIAIENDFATIQGDLSAVQSAAGLLDGRVLANEQSIAVLQLGIVDLQAALDDLRGEMIAADGDLLLALQAVEVHLQGQLGTTPTFSSESFWNPTVTDVGHESGRKDTVCE